MDAYQEICAKNSAYDIKRIDDPAFKQYGTLWNEFDLTELEAFCNKNVKIDSEKNFYVPSNPALEKLTLIQQVSNEVYAGMPLEAGECTGQTRDFTAVEYHQGSEVNVALTDVVMVLAHRAILEEKGSIDPKEDAKLFFVLPAPYLKCTAIHFTTARSKFMLQASKSSSFCRRVQISLSLKNSVLKTSESLRKTSSSSSTPAEKIKSRPVLKSALLEI